MLYDKSFIQVLWVEDNNSIHELFAAHAEKSDIQLVAVDCWDDAELLLEEDYDRWQAIILDAKCKFKKNDADKANKFLSHTFDSLNHLFSRKGRTIPWYVLSGQGEDEIRDLIPPSRRDWDADWDATVFRPYYDKNKFIAWGGLDKDGNQKMREEYKVLFDRIKSYVLKYNVDLALRVDLYPEVFKAIDDLKLPGEVDGFLIDLLGPIHFKGTKNSDYNRRYADVRKILEHIFRHMIDNKILPQSYRSENKKKEINLSWSSEFLGKDEIDHQDNRKKSRTRVIRHCPPLLPKQLADMLKITVFQCGGAVHTSEVEAEIQLNLDKYLPLVNYSPNMLRAISSAMCDFIIWYGAYFVKHTDIELNALEWDIETIENNN